MLPKVAVWGLGIGAVYFLVLKPVLESLGLKKTEEDKALDAQSATYSTGTGNAFDPKYYKTVTGANLLTRARAEGIAAELYNALGFWNDAETKVYAALRKITYKTQLSWVAEVFASNYGKDLYQYLRGGLDDSEMTIVHGIVNGLK